MSTTREGVLVCPRCGHTSIVPEYCYGRPGTTHVPERHMEALDTMQTLANVMSTSEPVEWFDTLCDIRDLPEVGVS